jgi:sterol desaturase/sphingolipid hydroxylase (fatty acid hydroxylase superfamily)
MSEMITSYTFWLVVIAAFCVMAERMFPWRHTQSLLRPELTQDIVWLVFNGYLATFALGGVLRHVEWGLGTSFTALAGRTLTTFQLVTALPLAAQIGIVLVASDFVEWFVHNALHRWGPLWSLHRVHHSITTMDWIGNFRFHWGEILLYKSIKYIPLAVLGARWEAILIAAVFATLVGNLNHSNLNISWGPFRYLLNSPRMHIWHHDKTPERPAGVNFGVVFSLWDWIFGTAYMPSDAAQPQALGFRNMERVPTDFLMRFFLPMLGKTQRNPRPADPLIDRD